MGWEADSAHSLAVKDQAAEQVGKKLDGLVAQLEDRQAKFKNSNSNLGMDGAPEGNGPSGWNHYVDDANKAIYEQLGKFIETAKVLAKSAHDMQEMCHQIEDSAADKFEKLDRGKGFPQS